MIRAGGCGMHDASAWGRGGGNGREPRLGRREGGRLDRRLCRRRQRGGAERQVVREAEAPRQQVRQQVLKEGGGGEEGAGGRLPARTRAKGERGGGL